MPHASETSSGMGHAMRRTVGKPRSSGKTKAMNRSSGDQSAGSNATGGAISAAERFRMIATAAYYRAEHRGFAAGRELED